MLTVDQVEVLYNRLMGLDDRGEPSKIEDLEANAKFGPLLVAWRESLNEKGTDDFTGFATMLLQGDFEVAPMLSLMKAEQGARDHFSTLIGEIRELATSIGFRHELLVYNKSKVRRLIDDYDEQNPEQEPEQSPAMTMAEKLAAAKKMATGSRKRFQKVRYWLGIAHQDDVGTGPLSNGHSTEEDPAPAKVDKLADLF